MRFRLVALLAILLTFGFTAKATDVTITQVDLATNSVSAKIPNFNVSNLGNAITISSVTVTNGTYATLTCSACFRPSWVGLGGFTIKVGTDLYTVRNVDTTSQVTLTKGCTQPTPSTVIWYPYVEFRIYSDRAFQPLGANYIVQPGTPGTGSWYKRYAASILDVNSVKTLYLPEMTIDATTDAVGPTNQARYMAGFYRPDNSFVQFYACFEQFRVPTTTPTTWTALCAYNSPPAIVPPANEAYTKTQIDARFPSCTTGQMIYYATTGQIQTCLTVGSGLTISGGSISTTGSAGTVTSVALSLPNIFTVSGSPVTTTGTLTGTLATQNNRLVFAGPIGFPYPTGSTGVAAAPTFRALNFYDQAQTRAALNVITDFYCSGDGTTTTTGNMSSGTDTLTVASASTWRVGEGIRVMGAGVAGQPLDATVSAISGTTFTLDVLASTTVVGAVVYHNDTACIDLAILNAQAAGYFGKIVYLPAGTYNIYGTLSVPGGVTLEGDGRDKTIISSTYNGIILDLVQGGGASLFYGPTVRNLSVKGDVTAGTSQVGIRSTDASYMFNVSISQVDILNTGSHGLSIGNTYSSRFSDLYISNTAGWPLLYDSANMPTNYFEKIYVGNLRTYGGGYNTAAYRIKAGDFVCYSCNGVNNVVAASKWAVVGKKSGTDGDGANGAASFRCIDCNLETWVGHGILAYYGSLISVVGQSQFAVDATGVGTGKPIEYEHINNGVDYYAEFTRRGYIDDQVVFQQALSSYANSQAIHSNGFAPIQTLGRGPSVAGGTTIKTFYNSTAAATAYLSRADGNVAKVTVTTSTSFTDPTIRYIEANCAAACTITLPWPTWYQNAQEVLIIKDISGGAATNNVTISANSGGTVNGSSYTLNKNNGSVVLVPNDTATDWRVVGVYDPSGGGSSLTATYVGYGSGSNLLTGSSRLTWDNSTYKLSLSNNATLGLLLQAGGGTTAAHPASAYGLIMPYVGGGQATAGPGIFWTDGTYTSMVGLWLNLGLNFQGTGGVNNFKIRKATDAGSDGDIVFDLRPNDGRFDLYPYGASAGNTTQIAFRELAANGTNYVAFKAADSLAGDVTWTLPSVDSTGIQCFASNGSGTISWVACSGGGGTPGGSNKQVQFNNSSAFGGAAGFEYQSGASPNVSITAQNAAYVPLYVNGASSQTANLQQWAVNSTIFNVITKDGYLYLGRGETSATPSGGRIYATGGSGTNIAGASLVLYGGAGTGTGAGGSIAFYTAAASTTGSTPNTPVIQYELDQKGNHFFGNAQLAQAATDGFVHIPGIANVPSGVPTLITGLVPLAVDETNYRLYGYSGGAWRNLTGAASGITIGTTAITSGTAGRILYETAGNVVGETAGFTFQPAASPNLTITAQAASYVGLRINSAATPSANMVEITNNGTNLVTFYSQSSNRADVRFFDNGTDEVRIFPTATGGIYLTNSNQINFGGTGAASAVSPDVAIARATAGVLSIQSQDAAQGRTLRFVANSATQITANQDNYTAGTVRSYFQRWSSDASRDVTGFSNSQVDGQVHLVVNVGSFDIVLKHESASSTAANRFTNSTGADITLTPNQAADLIYSGTTSRWLVFKRN